MSDRLPGKGYKIQKWQMFSESDRRGITSKRAEEVAQAALKKIPTYGY